VVAATSRLLRFLRSLHWLYLYMYLCMYTYVYIHISMNICMQVYVGMSQMAAAKSRLLDET